MGLSSAWVWRRAVRRTVVVKANAVGNAKQTRLARLPSMSLQAASSSLGGVRVSGQDRSSVLVHGHQRRRAVVGGCVLVQGW